MSQLSFSRAGSLSSTSSFSSASDTLVDTDVDSSKPTETKRTRKRFTQEQLIVLENAYHKSSHPTREEREELAKLADMSIKSVTIWFQNKRQAERKQALNKADERAAPPPLATYPAQPPSTQVSSTNASTHPNPAVSHSSIAFSKSQSRLPSRAASGFISLDRIASRSERVPKTPTKLTRHTSFYEPRSRSRGALWDSMLSSPIQPEPCENTRSSPPESPSARDYLDFASTRRGSRGNLRSRCTLELACATARMSVDKVGDSPQTPDPSDAMSRLSQGPDIQRMALYDVDDDASTEIVDTEMESIEDGHEAITPDASQIMFADDAPFSQARYLDIEKSTLDEEKTPRAGASIDFSGGDMDIVSAAWALYGLSTSRR